jgi:hypothetical protein
MKPAAPVVRPLARISVLVIVPLLIALGASTAAGAVNSTVARPSNAKHQPARPTLKTAAPRAPQTTTTTTTTGKPAAALSRTPATAILLSHIAHTYTVRKLNDLSNGTTCGVNCTLRNAINKANATPGVDLITFAKIGTITLNTTYGSLNPTTSMVIQGLGPAKTVVSGLGCTCGLFDIEYGTNRPTVEIDGMKMTKGSGESGGGVYVGSAAVILDHDVITDNKVGASYYGGGAYFDGSSSYADEVSGLNVHATKNSASGSGYIYGGVLYETNYLQLNGATFSATTNAAGGNGAYIYGGVGYLYYQSNFTRVKAIGTIDKLPGDGTYAQGGAFNFYDYVTAVNMSVVGTTVTLGLNGYGYGGAIYDDYASSFDRLTVAGTTFSATGALSYLYGGGMYLDSTINVVNSTIAGNHITSPATASGYGGFGGGVYMDDAVTFTNDTIAGNTAGPGRGGGIYDDGYLQTFRNTIVSGNAGRNCATNTGSTLLSAGHNLEKGTTCHFNQAGDLNTVASLGLLKNNGGFAATMMPKPGSPAINHAGNGGCPAVDERGVARPQHKICDIGAVEVKLTSADRIRADGAASDTEAAPFVVRAPG